MKCHTLLMPWLWALLPMVGQPVSIQYTTLPPAEIERRLNAVEHTNIKRGEKLMELFQQSGCGGDRLTQQPVKYTKAPNIVCILPGETENVILLGAHFDFIDQGAGIVDNWSGSSMLPSLYESSQAFPRRHTFMFVGFTDEEKGLVGSRYYVGKMKKEEIKRISAMVNLDSLGTSPTKMEIEPGEKKLWMALGKVATALQLPLSVVNVRVGRTDSDSFLIRKVPTINIHSLTNETFRILHTPKDQIQAIQLKDYYESYLLVRAYLAYLDQILDAPADPAAEAAK